MKNIPEDVYKAQVLRDHLFLEAAADTGRGVPQKKYFHVNVPEVSTRRGVITLKNYTPSEFDIAPHPVQLDLSQKIMSMLNKEYHHDGIWVVGWTHPPDFDQLIRIDGDNVWSRMIMIYLDKDADYQFVVESEMPIATMIENGIEYYCGLCEEAFDTYSRDFSHESLGISESQLNKATLQSLN